VIRYERDDRGELWAVRDVRVGIDRIGFRVPLGEWDGDEPDRGGLRQLPVVVLPGDAGAQVVEAAASRAGRAGVSEALPTGPGLLSAAAGGAEVLVVRRGNGRAMNVIRALGGRPLPALPGADPRTVRAFLDGCHVDLDIATPRMDDAGRVRLRAALDPLRLEEVHHLVEVDPHPGLDPGGIGPDLADEGSRFAAAAGVLAGRLAAGRRRHLADGT